jgi:hypothetical protein
MGCVGDCCRIYCESHIDANGFCLNCSKARCSVDGCQNAFIDICSNGCGVGVCEQHLDQLRTCTCGGDFCVDCIDNHDCPDKPNDICSADGCIEEVINTCVECGKSFCEEHVYKCSGCKKLFCDSCGLDHDCPANGKCSWDGCLEVDIRTCVECYKSFCEEHVIQCPDCKKIFCNSCFDEHKHTCTYC